LARSSGDPEKLADKVIEEARRNIERKINEALEASRTILTKAFEDAVADASKRLGEELRRLEDQLRSSEAVKDVELKRELAKIRAELVDEVVKEALENLHDRVPTEQYKGFLRRLLTEAKEKMGDIEVIPVEIDVDLVSEIAQQLGVSVRGETEKGYGGFIAVSKTGVRADYRIDNVLRDTIDKLKEEVAKILFPE